MRRLRTSASPFLLRAPFLVASLLLLPPPVAAVEKCVAPNGRISYQERCPPGARSAPITGGTTSSVGPASAAAPASGGASGSTAASVLSRPPGGVDMQYYDVQGRDIPSLHASLRAVNGGNFHATARWRLGYEYRTRVQAGACAVASLDTRLELSIRFPRWTPPADASADAVARWQRYVAALRTHEDGHLDHGRSAEREFKAVAATLQAPDCETLKTAIRARYDRLVQEYGKRDKDYDARTGHGKTQGAFLN